MTLNDMPRSFQYCCCFVCAADARSVSDSYVRCFTDKNRSRPATTAVSAVRKTPATTSRSRDQTSNVVERKMSQVDNCSLTSSTTDTLSINGSHRFTVYLDDRLLINVLFVVGLQRHVMQRVTALSVCLSVCLFVCLSVCLYVCTLASIVSTLSPDFPSRI